VSFAADSVFEQGAELGERRYLVATLLIDAWLPRAMERDLAAAERKAMYWSEIYGPRRTRISEIFVPGATSGPRVATTPPPPPPPPRPKPQPQAMPRETVEPEKPRARQTPRGGVLALIDRPIDPAYAKAMCDLFLLYIATKLLERMFGTFPI
jgi:hypothetical protein